MLWLEHGELEGDDTDAHVDTLARFAAPDAIVYQACDDPSDSHYAGLQDDPQPSDDEAVLARVLGRRIAQLASRLA